MTKRVSLSSMPKGVDDIPKGSVKELAQLLMSQSQGIARGTSHEVQQPQSCHTIPEF